MTTRAEALLGPQRDLTGGEREEPYRTERQVYYYWKDRERRSRYDHWRQGKLHRISRTGEVLHSQSARWEDWPQLGRAFRLATVTAHPSVWLTARVSSVDHTRGGDCVEFVAGGVRYRLEVER